jgi:hypothetical protein
LWVTWRGITGPKCSKVGPPHQRKLDALLASPMNQPSPSGGEFGRLTAIHLRLVATGLGHIEESFELFELL